MRLPCISSSAHAAIRKHCSLAPTAPGICSAPPQATQRIVGGPPWGPEEAEGGGRCHPPLLPARALTSSRLSERVSTMILPQVHLRKPCYDFSFL